MCHYNYRRLENCHYYSLYCIDAIIILCASDICHFVRSGQHWTHMHPSVFSYGPKCPYYSPLSNPMTRGTYTSSPSSLLLLPPNRPNLHRAKSWRGARRPAARQGPQRTGVAARAEDMVGGPASKLVRGGALARPWWLAGWPVSSGWYGLAWRGLGR
jgi:hypothetical protein